MKRKIYILTIFILVSLFALSSCTIGHIEDTNGEDTSPVTLTDEDIVKSKSHTATLSSKGHANSTYYYNASKLSGVLSLNKHRVDDGTLVINMTSTLLSGNARICVLLDGEIKAEIPLGEGQSVSLSGNGLYEIKIAAESAQITVEYTVE